MMKNTILTTCFPGVRALFPMTTVLPCAVALADAVGNRKTGMIIAAFGFT
jgi:hypothetical protein